MWVNCTTSDGVGCSIEVEYEAHHMNSSSYRFVAADIIAAPFIQASLITAIAKLSVATVVDFSNVTSDIVHVVRQLTSPLLEVDSIVLETLEIKSIRYNDEKVQEVANHLTEILDKSAGRSPVGSTDLLRQAQKMESRKKRDELITKITKLSNKLKEERGMTRKETTKAAHEARATLELAERDWEERLQAAKRVAWKTKNRN